MPSAVAAGHSVAPALFIVRAHILAVLTLDMLIAVNRAYNKSDYLPCIAWGRNARFTGDLNVGDKVELSGRIQSREYIKKIDMDNAETKTAYEVSVSTVALLVKDEDEVSENEINKINIRSEYEYDEEEASVR